MEDFQFFLLEHGRAAILWPYKVEGGLGTCSGQWNVSKGRICHFRKMLWEQEKNDLPCSYIFPKKMGRNEEKTLKEGTWPLSCISEWRWHRVQPSVYLWWHVAWTRNIPLLSFFKNIHCFKPLNFWASLLPNHSAGESSYLEQYCCQILKIENWKSKNLDFPIILEGEKFWKLKKFTARPGIPV